MSHRAQTDDVTNVTHRVRFCTAASRRRGGALVLSLLAVVAVVGVAAAAFTLSLAQSQEVDAVTRQTRALYLAEAGLTDAIAEIASKEAANQKVPTTLGTKDIPVKQKSGQYWTDLVDNGDGTYTVTATGATTLSRFSLEALVGPVGGGIFHHAIFAGNSSGDVNYTLGLGGSGGQADVVTGDIFSGGDVDMSGDAKIIGDTFASGIVTGAVGVENVSRPIPNIGSMNYETNHDYDVAALFSTATWLTDSVGGGAYQMPEASPAHIFRKNPNDRTDETSGTAKDDYFLEDPYESLMDWVAPTGTKGHRISLAGTMGDPGTSSTDKVYYIDGNLWIHNKPIGRFVLENTDPDGFKVTFVVKGNIYFSDDIYLGDDTTDGVAFIAIEDDNEPDSGNIYLGDPRYGTVEYLETFLYAENDFHDLNLSADGSKQVEIVGNMTAGNQVKIERDYTKSDGTVEHSQLAVEFDDRLATGALELPGLPSVDGGIGGFSVRAWRRVSE